MGRRSALRTARATITCVAAAAVFSGAQAAGQTAPSYRLDTIPMQGGVKPVEALAINNLGAVVGQANVKHDKVTQCFKYEQGKVTLLQDSRWGACRDINDAGEVVGKVDIDIRHYAAMWTVAGERQLVGPADSEAIAINAEHQVVGHFTVGGKQHAALFADGTVTDLHVFGDISEAQDINASGKVVGYFYDEASFSFHAFAWQNGAVREICKLDGASDTYASSVNDQGQVLCGADFNYEDGVAFVEDEDGTQHPIPRVHGRGLLPVRMNDSGENVGRDYAPHLVPYYSTGAETQNLLKLVTVNAGDWSKLLYAQDINRSGQIVGSGLSSLGKQRAYIATKLTSR